MPALSFIIPVRDHASVPDWPAAMLNLQETAASVVAQTCPSWQCVVVAGRNAPLPSLPAKVHVHRLDLPPPLLLPAVASMEARFEAIRADKGRRVLAGILACAPDNYIMCVDYDDLVSNRLADFALNRPGRSGWYVDSGLLYDGSSVLMRLPSGFDELCGTSLIIHAQEYRLPHALEAADETYLRQWFGSHKFAKRHLALAGRPLDPLPFVGAIYRIGHAAAVSSSGTVLQQYLPRWLLRKDPVEFARRCTRLRRLSTATRAEFFGETAKA